MHVSNKRLMHPMQFFHAATLALLMIAAPAICAEPPPREQWGAPLVSVTNHGGTWTIRGQKQVVTLRESDLSLQIKAGSTTWTMMPSKADDMLMRSGGKDFALRL